MPTKLTVYQKLANVQKALKVPKGQYNKFGKYYYRSLEDITEAAKPLCIENGLLLTLTDELTNDENRYHLKSCARVTDTESGEKIETFGYAMEAESKKGMDEAQVTGSCSTYARKYACNGLFALDDVKDSDTMDNTRKGEKTDTADSTPKETKYAKSQIKYVEAMGDTTLVRTQTGMKNITELTQEELELLLKMPNYKEAHAQIKNLLGMPNE